MMWQWLTICCKQCCIKYILKVFQLQNTNYIFKLYFKNFSQLLLKSSSKYKIHLIALMLKCPVATSFTQKKAAVKCSWMPLKVVLWQKLPIAMLSFPLVEVFNTKMYSKHENVFQIVFQLQNANLLLLS